MAGSIVSAAPRRSSAGLEQDRRWAEYVARLSGSDTAFSEQWLEYERIYAGRLAADGPPLVWHPRPDDVHDSNIFALQQLAGVSAYEDLYRWSIRQRPAFVSAMLERLQIAFRRRPGSILDAGEDPRHVDWLPGGRLNIADSCFTTPKDRTAILFATEADSEPVALSYGELEERVEQAAAAFLARGLSGRGVALYMPMNIECVVAYLAVIRAGAFVVSIAESFPAPELRRRLEQSRAAAIVTVRRFWRAGKRLPLYRTVCEATALPAVVVGRSSQETLRSQDISWEDFLETAAGGETDSVVGRPDDTINVLFSSGTTGQPKAIPWTHVTPLKCAIDGHLHQDIHREDIVSWPTSIGWMMGPWLIFASLINGATMALFEGNPASSAFLDFVQRAEVSILGVVPALVRSWREHNRCSARTLSGVRIFSSTGEASNVPDYLWLMSRGCYRAPVIEYLGGTEIGGGHITGSVVQPASPTTFTTPTLGTELILLNDDNEAAESGEQAEMFLVPPALGMSQRLVGADHDTIYYVEDRCGPKGEMLRRHGDQMAQLPHGFVAAHGRVDDTMNLGGIKVSAREIESVIDRHPDVRECAAVSVRLPAQAAEHLVVFVVPVGGATGESLKADVSRALATRLNPLFRLHDLVCLEELPRTASNKVMRRRLRDGYPDI